MAVSGPEDEKDEAGGALAVQDESTWLDRLGSDLRDRVLASRIAKPIIAGAEKLRDSDAEMVVRTREAAGELHETFNKVKTKVLEQSETALAINAAKQSLPDFDVEIFSEEVNFGVGSSVCVSLKPLFDSMRVQLETIFVPKLLRAYYEEDMVLLRKLCADPIFTQFQALSKQRKAAKQRLIGEVLDVKRIELYEGLLDGQEPVLKFSFDVHLREAIVNEEGDVVEGDEAEIQNHSYMMEMRMVPVSL